MAKLSTDELLDAFKEMTLIELSEFVKNFEETFGVTAAAPVAVAAAPGAGAGGGDAAAEEEKDEFDVVLPQGAAGRRRLHDGPFGLRLSHGQGRRFPQRDRLPGKARSRAGQAENADREGLGAHTAHS